MNEIVYDKYENFDNLEVEESDHENEENKIDQHELDKKKQTIIQKMNRNYNESLDSDSEASFEDEESSENSDLSASNLPRNHHKKLINSSKVKTQL